MFRRVLETDAIFVSEMSLANWWLSRESISSKTHTFSYTHRVCPIDYSGFVAGAPTTENIRDNREYLMPTSRPFKLFWMNRHSRT